MLTVYPRYEGTENKYERVNQLLVLQQCYDNVAKLMALSL